MNMFMARREVTTMGNLKDQAKGAYNKADAAAENAASGIAKKFGVTKTVGYIIMTLAVLGVLFFVFGGGK